MAVKLADQMDNLFSIFDLTWEHLSSTRLLRKLDVSRSRFYRHPLYRRWSAQAYSHRWAHLAEALPEKISQYTIVILLVVPLLALLIQVLLGEDIFDIFVVLFGVTGFLMAIVMSISGVGLASSLASMSVAAERSEGRWDLLMMLPNDRASVLLMRIASMLYPYRPLIATFDVLQGAVAFMSVLAVTLAVDMRNDDLISLCFVYILPCIALLIWERRQDNVLSLVTGAFAGLFYGSKNALSMAMIGTGLLLAFRLMIVLGAFAAMGRSAHLLTLLPALIGGPAMLPVIGLPFWGSIGFIVAYYAVREVIIGVVWQAVVQRMRDN